MNLSLSNIRDLLKNNIADNTSGGQVVLSVGESLLLILNACKKANQPFIFSPNLLKLLTNRYQDAISSNDEAKLSQLFIYLKKYLEPFKSASAYEEQVKTQINSQLENEQLTTAAKIQVILDKLEQANHVKKELPYFVAQTTIDKLNHLYLGGIKSKDDKELIKEIKDFLKEEKHYTVKSEPKIINEDPTRRYFETQLGFHLLQNNAESLKHESLHKFTQNLKKRYFQLLPKGTNQRMKVDKILKGDMDAKVLNKYELEYAELTHKLLTNNYHGLSAKACKNLYEIACATILATLNTQLAQPMPVDIYNDSIFTMGMDGRGRIVKMTNDHVNTTAQGLMKSTTPLPVYDSVVNPSQGKSHSPFQRSADQANFMIESQWSQHLFAHQTQLYSNGISSTTLAQIRNIILQKRLGNLHFKGKLQEYMTAFAGLMVFNSGGHSFFEIFEVFKLPQFRDLGKTDSSLAKGLEEDDLMYQWLCLAQPDAYNKALEATQDYSQTLLNKKILNAQMTKGNELGLNESQQPTLHLAVINDEPEQFDKSLQLHLKNKSNGIDERNDKHWTALMVASQLGKTAQVVSLIAAGANIKARTDVKTGNLSSLELAIKNQHAETVEVLIKAGAIIRRDTANSPSALYFASRQTDGRILNLVLNNEKKFTPAEKRQALLNALKVENFEAISIIVNHMNKNEHEQQRIFTTDFKNSFLQAAVSIGNSEVIHGIIELDIWNPNEKINYNTLINITVEKGFIPTAKQILNLARNAGKEDDNKLSINLNAALIQALEHNHFDMALVLIINGASPDAIPTSCSSLKGFEEYLRSEQYYSFIFTEERPEAIALRTVELQNDLAKRQNGALHRLITLIVDFLNNFLPDSIRLGYSDKTNLLKTVSDTFLQKKSKDIELPIETQTGHATPPSLGPLKFFGERKQSTTTKMDTAEEATQTPKI
ncbi:MAG: ankyrin repeat domain-containing protein [bacterium]|nr:ankyrin repeat domain-containing protein [bacterium]